MIVAENLGREFGHIKAVKGISFSVDRGEVLGFLGPNGAGKSTTMKMLTCFLTPSKGTARVGGFDILTQSRQVRASLGYLPENAPLYSEMEIEPFLSFVAEVRGISGTKKKQAIERVLELTSLGEVRRQRIETLSKGYKRRVGLAQALVHDPEILILDEPTDGLDPNQKHEVRLLLTRMASEKCILLSTHILEEVEEICSRVVIIAQGEIVADSTPMELKRRSANYGAIHVDFKKTDEEQIFAELCRLPSVRSVSQEELGEGSVRFILFPDSPEVVLTAFFEKAREKHWHYNALGVEEGKLDDVFREITNR